MTARGVCVAVVLLGVLACRGREDGHAEHAHEEHAPEAQGGEEHAHEGAGHEDHPAEAPDHLLRIAPEMLRDLRVTTTAVEARPGGDGVTALGEIGVNEERYAEVGAPIAARVADVLAGIGDTVAAGQPLAVVESVELGKARGGLITARARVAVTRQGLARKRGLAGVVPRREIEEAEAAAVAAAADLRAAEAGLRALGAVGDEAADSDAARLEVRAPIAGIVIDRDAVRGHMVEPAHVLFRVADLSRLWLTVHVFERDAVRVAAGATARVSLAALPGRAFTGTVTLVGRRVDPGSRTVAVRVDLDNPDALLRPGMSASAWLPFEEAGTMVVAVPAAAVQRVDEGWAVFLPRADGVFEPRQVGRGRDLGGEVEILHGLTPGETVVVDGAFLLKAESEKSRGEGEHHDH